MRRLKRRLPVRLRQHWKVVAAGLAFLALLGVLSDSRVRPLVTSDSREATEVVTEDIAGLVDVFDLGTAYTVALTYAEEDYQRMFDQFQADGSKEYIRADLVIDDTVIPDVGIRLKGNSTLMGLRGGGDEARGLGASSLSSDQPESLPWLLSFDWYVEGRRYQGLSELAIRPASQTSSTLLNEAVGLTLVGRSDEPTQRFTYSSVTVNDRPAATRLLVENPSQAYAQSLDGDGVLYKSRASSQFTYRGDDPTDYQEDFDQLNLTGSQDLQPVIDLIWWVEESSDEEFAAELADRVDVESFARYVALQNLLLNSDDMSGPGSNYYLYYDLDTKRFTVVSWDLNLTLSGDASQGPYDSGSLGGFPGGGRGQPGGEGQPDGEGPPGEGFEPPEGFAPPGGGDGGQRGFGGGHPLKERFLELEAFHKVYEDTYRDLYQALYADGTALQVLEQLTAALRDNGADESSVESEVESLRTLIEDRTGNLATSRVIAG